VDCYQIVPMLCVDMFVGGVVLCRRRKRWSSPKCFIRTTSVSLSKNLEPQQNSVDKV